MKILIVTHYFKPHIGGIEIVAYNQAKELVKKGHEVTIVTSRLNREKAVEQKESGYRSWLPGRWLRRKLPTARPAAVISCSPAK